MLTRPGQGVPGIHGGDGAGVGAGVGVGVGGNGLRAAKAAAVGGTDGAIPAQRTVSSIFPISR